MVERCVKFHEKFCAICNKMIFPTSEWVYKIRGDSKKDIPIKYYCSYSCWRAAGGGGNYGRRRVQNYPGKK